MNAQLPQIRQTLTATLDCLLELNENNVRPKAARERFRQFQQQQGIPMDLVWEEERFDGSVHYDALLHIPGEGTVSVSFAPDHALPWPMRGTRRWDESTLLRVNQEYLNMEQAVAFLDFMWNEAPLVKRLVNVCLIQEELKRNCLELSNEEMQDAMDAFRRARRLYTAEETRRWIEDNGTTQEKLEQIVGGEALVEKLRNRVTAGHVEEYFEQHRAEFDRVIGFRIDFADAQTARQSLGRIRTGDLEFQAAAKKQFLASVLNGSPAPHTGYITMRRSESETELGAAMFAAAPGELVGPFRDGTRWCLVQVHEQGPARLDATTRREIQQRLFDEWLEARRKDYQIEWLWGNANQTALE